MKKVTTFEEFKIKSILDLLAEVAERAKRGEVNGLLLSIKQGQRHHGIGLLGDYLDDPAQVASVTTRINYRANQLIDERLLKGGDGKVLPFGNGD
jgi:hypothetical protein